MGYEREAVADAAVEICELGDLGIRANGQWHPVRGERTRTAVAALSLHRIDGVRTQSLIEAVWPSPDQPPTARQSLANLVSRLRAAHGEHFIESTGDGYRLGADVISDRAQFLVEVAAAAQLAEQAPSRALEAVDAALGRVRGRPWHDVELPHDVDADRAHLETQATRARRIRARALIALDRTAEAASLLDRLIDDDPTDESTWFDLASAFADLGRRVDALRTLRRARNELAQYGLTIDEPSAELERRLLQGAPELNGLGAEFPLTPTSLVGRDCLLADVAELMDANRLVTLRGPGGVGKTRLAVALAECSDVGDRFFVDLSPVRDERSVPSAIAAALGVVVPPGTAPTDALTEAFRSRRALLVLDNCEQVVGSVAHVVSSIVQDCSSVSLITTSREHLGIPAERVVNVEPLPTGPTGAGVELFFERSRRLGVDLPPEVWRDPVAELCRALDGLPLAIELAAGRTTVLNPTEINVALEERFVLLQDPDSGVNLEGAIRWSWDLLDGSQQRALHHLSVFGSGCTLDAAASVLGLDRWTVLDLAERLSRKSLLQIRHAPNRPTRLELLDSVRYFVLADAEQRGVIDSCRDAHLAWIDEFTTRTLGEHGHDGGIDPLTAIDRERHELATALDHAASERGDAVLGVRICLRCFHWWRGRSTAPDGVEWLKRLLLRADLPAGDRASAAATLAAMARIAAVSDAEVNELVADAHRLLDQMSPSAVRDRIELRLAEAEFDDRDPTLGARLRRLADADTPGGDLGALHLLTAWAITNTPDEAPAIVAEFAALAARAPSRSEPCNAHAREFEGLVAVVSGRLDDAGNYLADAVDLHCQSGQTFCAIHCCESIAWLVAESGDCETSRSLLASTQGLRRVHARNRAGFEQQAITGALRHLGALPAPVLTADIHETIDRARHAARRLRTPFAPGSS